MSVRAFVHIFGSKGIFLARIDEAKWLEWFKRVKAIERHFFWSKRTLKISGLHMNMLFYGDQNVNLYLILQCHYISFSFRYLLKLIFIQKHRAQ